jgi:hypothetical protein
MDKTITFFVREDRDINDLIKETVKVMRGYIHSFTLDKKRKAIEYSYGIVDVKEVKLKIHFEIEETVIKTGDNDA